MSEWRPIAPADLDAVMAIQDIVHTLLPERRAVFEDKVGLAPACCAVLVQDDRVVGYALAHPWRLDDVPPLDTVLGHLPAAPDCLFLHDVALLPAARGRGAGRAFVGRAGDRARALGLSTLALVSVYDSGPAWAACGFAPRAFPGLAAKMGPYGASARYMTARLT